MAITLTPEELDEFLLTSPHLILGIASAKGAPVIVPMGFAWSEGRIVMNTGANSSKVAMLRRRPEVSCLVETGVTYFTLKAARLEGPCRIIEDDPRLADWNAFLCANKPIYKGASPETWPASMAKRRDQRRLLLEVTPRRIVSWDNRKIPH